MSELNDSEGLILEIVAASEGRWDTRSLDFEYYRRRQRQLEPSLLHVLRDLERRGLVTEVPIVGGTGPGWKLTASGKYAAGLAEDSPG